MHKRFVTTLIVCIACIACAFGFTACGENADPVAGKTYEFESVAVEADDAVKDMMEATMNSLYADSSIAFEKDGNFTMIMMGHSVSGTYEQSGSTVTLTYEGKNQKVTVSDNRIVITEETEGVKVSVNYKLVADENEGEDEEGDEGDDNEDEGEASGGAMNVAGKTFAFSDLTVSFDSSVSQEMKDLINGSLSDGKAMYAGSTIVFDTNGGFAMTVQGRTATGVYTQNGKTLSLTAESVDGAEGDISEEESTQVFTLNGNEISASYTSDGITQTMIYSLQENA